MLRNENFVFFFDLIHHLFYMCKHGFRATRHNVSAWPRTISYEIYVQSFADSDGDGKGDIKGMMSKLDYLKDLGVGSVWLMPMSPSPSYHKYDVMDYYGIDSTYGTVDDFKKFVEEAHKRNIKVVIDMVLNHSSSRHPWFVDARKSVDSKYRDYYVWTERSDPQTRSRGNVTAGETRERNHWVKLPGADSNYYYYAQFGGNMPDLNYDNPNSGRRFLISAASGHQKLK
jgi:alpha-amylase